MVEKEQAGYSVLKISRQTMMRINKLKGEILVNMSNAGMPVSNATSDDYIVNVLLDNHYMALESFLEQKAKNENKEI